ncbi:molybdate ABC transporter substrate-binding protein [Paenibacillus soyae]|uniref:Molybdate ABC transporter substrate-binding protein n=1 Tax=Paenibacillus soyae TaxID=2969249 RepID=A0A9X2SAP6_9BACL|nr:molybdate ABC transporter substrate-binding protein [Paenibacillus soyae]MCR2806541.1 molybdate ABC transporter substrate-binding protein [Paenibacillus soyae]
MKRALWGLPLAAAVAVVLGACGAGDRAGAGPAEKTELTVSAAASLTEALNELKASYEAANQEVTLSFNFGASGALQQQIEQGAPADLFISAASKNMNALIDNGFVEEEQTKDLLSNSLVVVTPKNGGLPLKDVQELLREDVAKLAVGIPESVPAGAYAVEALKGAGIWDSLQAKTVQAKDVKQVLQYVETGNVDAGFVYKTDAMSSDAAAIAFEVDPGTYSPILYPVGIVKDTDEPNETRKLYEYLQSEEAMAVFQKYGFSEPK